MTRGFDRLAGELHGAERRLAGGSARPERARGVLLPLATTAVVAAVLVIVLLTGLGARHVGGHGAGPATSPGPAGVPTQSGWRLRCSEIVGTQAPPKSMRIVLGAVVLPGRPSESRALGAAGDGARLFAKSGLWVRNGARFQLIVPAELRGRLTMTWGNAGEGNHGATMADPACHLGHTRWIDFVGGYWVRRPMCATLIVVGDGRRRRVRIGIGTGCPGQRPPLLPSQS